MDTMGDEEWAKVRRKFRLIDGHRWLADSAGRQGVEQDDRVSTMASRIGKEVRGPLPK